MKKLNLDLGLFVCNMRFECKVRVVNKNPGSRSGTVYLTSTIAVGKETYTDNDYFLLHFSNVIRGSLSGSRFTKYHLKCNPTKIFSKCLTQGKIMVSFEKPPHDLYIQADASKLGKFVELLNACLAGEVGVLQACATQTARERYSKYLQEELEKQALLHQMEAFPEKIAILEDGVVVLEDSDA